MRKTTASALVVLAGCSAGVPLPEAARALNNAGVEALSRGDL